MDALVLVERDSILHLVIAPPGRRFSWSCAIALADALPAALANRNFFFFRTLAGLDTQVITAFGSVLPPESRV